MVGGPICPVCGADEAGPPDMLLVHRCGRCGVEFRPPGRIPVRHASVTPAGGLSKGWAGLLLAAGVIVGLTMAIGDAHAPRAGSLGPPSLELPPTIELPPLELPLAPELDLSAGLDLAGLGAGIPVELEHELHVSSRRGSELFMTGVVRNVSEVAATRVELAVVAHDARGAELATLSPTLACPSMRAGEVCGWVVEAELPGELSHFEFELRGFAERVAPFEALELRARYDASGRRLDGGDPGLALALEPGPARVEIELPAETSMSGAWVSLTALDASGQVLDVEHQRIAGSVFAARTISLAPPRRDEAASYRVAVGGRALALDLVEPAELPELPEPDRP